MALALLLGTGLAIAGLLVTAVQGFDVASGLGAGQAAARAVVTRHVALGISTLIFSLFSQSMAIFFFIGTGKLVKEETAGFPEEDRKRIEKALRRLKAKTSPPATFAILAAIAVFVLGGAVHTHALPSWVHLAATILALAVHAWAFAAEWAAFAENNRLMDDPRAWLTGKKG